jgi:hypothetical protein
VNAVHLAPLYLALTYSLLTSGICLWIAKTLAFPYVLMITRMMIIKMIIMKRWSSWGWW